MLAAVFLSALLVFLVCIIWLFERREVSLVQLSIICALSLLAGLSRVPCALVPSVQPTTFIVIISGIVFGPSVGAVVGCASALISNSFLGHGPWTLLQATAWAACGLSSGFFCRMLRGNMLIVGLFGFVWGFIFGAIMNTWHWLAFAYPLTLASWIVVSAASFWFDLVHAVVNASFLILFGTSTIALLERYQRRMNGSASIPRPKFFLCNLSNIVKGGMK